MSRSICSLFSFISFHTNCRGLKQVKRYYARQTNFELNEKTASNMG
jgi:hypothetical protein